METGYKISSEAVKKATGKGWDEWVSTLDKAGMAAKSHKEIAQWVYSKYGDEKKNGFGGWWSQGVTVGYEYAKGKRTVGETTQGVEIGVSRTIAKNAEELWNLATSKAGMNVWLGTFAELEPGTTYRTRDGATGEVRTVKEGSRIRLTWQPKDWAKPSTLQLYFEPKDGKTSLVFHHEKLPSLKERPKMKKHWQLALDRLEELC